MTLRPQAEACYLCRMVVRRGALRMHVELFNEANSERWDRFVQDAPMTTLLHTRRFLSYHGDRFQDVSVLLTDDRGELRAVLPAALDGADPARVVSHPGVTYGGLVHDGRLTGDRARDALLDVARHYARSGKRILRYKPVPYIYHRWPSADDIWALTELGAVRVGCDLSCAIDLAARRKPSTRRARSLAKAQRAGVEVSESRGLADFWPVLESTLERRHSVRPVHSLEEIDLLRARSPNEIRLVVASLAARVVAGSVLFMTPTVAHTQYMAASDDGMRVGALDAVLEQAIELAAEAGARYFDFGISPGEDRRGLNSGLYRFKAEFGGGGVVHEHYELALDGYQLSSSA